MTVSEILDFSLKTLSASSAYITLTALYFLPASVTTRTERGLGVQSTRPKEVVERSELPPGFAISVLSNLNLAFKIKYAGALQLDAIIS